MLLLPGVFRLLESFLWVFLFFWKLDVLAVFPFYVEEISDPNKNPHRKQREGRKQKNMG